MSRMHFIQSRRALVSYSLSGFFFLALASAASAANVEYRTKTDEATVYRTEALEPPPVTVLEKGVTLQLLHRGTSASLVKTEGGNSGWVSNANLIAVKSADGSRFKIGEQSVKSDELNASGDVWQLPVDKPDIVRIDRSFSNEINETIDREQTEMRNDDN